MKIILNIKTIFWFYMVIALSIVIYYNPNDFDRTVMMIIVSITIYLVLFDNDTADTVRAYFIRNRSDYIDYIADLKKTCARDYKDGLKSLYQSRDGIDKAYIILLIFTLIMSIMLIVLFWRFTSGNIKLPPEMFELSVISKAFFQIILYLFGIYTLKGFLMSLRMQARFAREKRLHKLYSIISASRED